MSRAKGLSTKLRSWGLLNENVKPHLSEMPQVQPLQIELQTFIEQAESLDAEQEEMRSRLRNLVQERQEVERKGELVRRRMAAHLRGTFGFTNEQLIRFGVKPRPRVIRRKAVKEGGSPPAASDTPAPQS
jgi:predicted nuclease with TOPRIM domain